MAPTGHRPSLDDPHALRVLSTIYRTRPNTVGDLAQFESLPRDLDSVLRMLAADGLVTILGDRIVPTSPDRVVAALSDEVLTNKQHELASLVEATSRLSTLTRDWELGASSDAVSPWAELVHGHEAQWHAWGRYAHTHPPVHPINLYPDLSVLRTLIVPSLTDDDRDTIAHTELRAVFPATVLADPADREFLDLLVATGAQVRIVDSVPSWVYSDAGVLCAVPVTWGEHPPTSIVIMQQPAIVALVSLLVESYWDRGSPYPSVDHGWQPILRLLATGMPDSTIAETLDLSLRTVQRRVTEAMEHYAVRSRFELGVAWSRDS